MKRLSIAEIAVTTVLGTGFSPVAPATVASAATCVILWFVPPLVRWPGMLLVIPAFFIGVWLSHRAIGAFDTVNDPRFRRFRRPNPKPDDPDQVVIDEFVGQWITLIAVADIHSIQAFITAFVVFRVFDILKPLGAGSLQKVTGGWGIMLDDVLAGIWGALLLMTLRVIPFLLIFPL